MDKNHIEVKRRTRYFEKNWWLSAQDKIAFRKNGMIKKFRLYSGGDTLYQVITEILAACPNIKDWIDELTVISFYSENKWDEGTTQYFKFNKHKLLMGYYDDFQLFFTET